MTAACHLQRVLLVEDDDDHAELVTYVISDVAPAIELVRAADGSEAIARMEQFARESEETHPDLVLLDLKLPLVDGVGVAEAFKNRVDMRHIPIVMLTTSAASSDRARAYRAGVNSYLVKPMELDELRELIATVVDYWGRHNQPARLSRRAELGQSRCG